MANFFTDRVVEHPGRVTLTATGGSNEYDIDRSEGTVTTAGTPFNASTFNGMLDQYGAWYGTCSTAMATTTKEVTCPGFTLVTGSTIAVYFLYGCEYNGQIKLDVNSTGAKNIIDCGQYYEGAARCAWDAGQTVFFTYDGTNWAMVDGPIITDYQLDNLETSLGIADGSRGRLYAIINQLIPKKGTQSSLSPVQVGTTQIYALITNVPIAKPFLAAYSTNRDGWILIPTVDTRVSQDYWILIPAAGTLSGQYDLVEYYIDVAL